mmetsp:Transcript_18945/g.52633  ORF Transcript_18945/g.52633 Transcript_18945/m.52633 type:complete len:264 (+) Transcript_18945:1473-2264(+)
MQIFHVRVCMVFHETYVGVLLDGSTLLGSPVVLDSEHALLHETDTWGRSVMTIDLVACRRPHIILARFSRFGWHDDPCLPRFSDLPSLSFRCLLSDPANDRERDLGLLLLPPRELEVFLILVGSFLFPLKGCSTVVADFLRCFIPIEELCLRAWSVAILFIIRQRALIASSCFRVLGASPKWGKPRWALHDLNLALPRLSCCRNLLALFLVGLAIGLVLGHDCVWLLGRVLLCALVCTGMACGVQLVHCRPQDVIVHKWYDMI